MEAGNCYQAKGSLSYVQRSQYYDIGFWGKKKLYCEVKQQGDRKHGSYLSPISGVWSNFSELGEEGWYVEVAVSGFCLQGSGTWPFVVRYGKGALAPDLLDRGSLPSEREGFNVQVLVHPGPGALVGRNTGFSSCLRSKFSPLHMLRLHNLQFWSTISEKQLRIMLETVCGWLCGYTNKLLVHCLERVFSTTLKSRGYRNRSLCLFAHWYSECTWLCLFFDVWFIWRNRWEVFRTVSAHSKTYKTVTYYYLCILLFTQSFINFLAKGFRKPTVYQALCWVLVLQREQDSTVPILSEKGKGRH